MRWEGAPHEGGRRQMQQTEHRSFEAPDETREFPHGRAEIVKVAGGEVGRMEHT